MHIVTAVCFYCLLNNIPKLGNGKSLATQFPDLHPSKVIALQLRFEVINVSLKTPNI